jgi:hypothetical protein
VKGRDDWVAAAGGPVEPIAYHALGGRPGFKLALRVANGRHYLYVSHLWHSGWSILDVTDPSFPEQVAFLPGPAGTWTLQVAIREKLLATSLEQVPTHWGGDSTAVFQEGVLLWDLTDPINPAQLSHVRTDHQGTHRNSFDSHGLLHLAAHAAGYEGMILVLIDVTNPSAPYEIGRFSMPDQVPGAVDSQGELLFGLHGPSIRVGDAAFLPYGNQGLVIIDVANPRELKLISHLNVRPPLGSRIAAHSAVPLTARNLLVLNSEALAENCREPIGYAGLVDISDLARPRMITLFPVPQPPAAAGYASFCEKGGRFGPHNQHIAMDDPGLLQDDRVCFLTYFNAGLRVFDIRDPQQVIEVGYIIPRDPETRIGPLPETLVVQVEDVLVDARGIVYFTEKNSGLYITKWHGFD